MFDGFTRRPSVSAGNPRPADAGDRHVLESENIRILLCTPGLRPASRT